MAVEEVGDGLRDELFYDEEGRRLQKVNNTREALVVSPLFVSICIIYVITFSDLGTGGDGGGDGLHDERLL